MNIIQIIHEKINFVDKYKHNLFLRKVTIILTNRYLLSFSLFFNIYLFYYLSLEKCYQGLEICCQKKNWIERKVNQELISCLLMIISIQLIFYKKISKLHLIHMIIAIIYFYKYSHGLDFDDHGYFNGLAYIAITLFSIILLLPLNVLIYAMKKKKLNISCILFFAVVFFSGLILLFLPMSWINCNDWPLGLNDTYIENDPKKYGCQIVIPKICPYKILSSYLDFTKIRGIKCDHIKKNSKQIILKHSKSPYLNENFLRLGYPLSNNCPNCLRDFDYQDNLLYKNFITNIVDMDNKDIINTVYKDKMPEIIVDFSNSTNGKMLININFNKKMSDERKALEKNTIPLAKNIE